MGGVTFSTEETFSFRADRPERGIVVALGGGTLEISAWDGSQFVLSDVIDADGAYVLWTQGLRLKFSPLGGAEYSISINTGEQEGVS